MGKDIKIKKEFYIKVESNPIKDWEDLITDLNKIKGYKFYQYKPRFGRSIKEQKKWLLKVGHTEALYADEWREFIGTISHRPQDIKDIIQKYLDKVIVSNKLLIIDRYFFPSRYDITYPNFVFDILEKYLITIDEITIITSTRHDKRLKLEIETLLKTKKSTLNLNYGFTDTIHDRFWISDYNKKGLILGTSLNGFGKKYALIDYLKINDVKKLISELQTIGLI